MLLPRILWIALVAITLSACNYNSSVMLRTKKDFVYDTLTPFDTTTQLYRLSPNDVINLRLYSNDGFKLIDLTSVNPETRGANLVLTSGLDYIVEQDGFVKLPILGRIKVSGMTLREAELMLEKKYAEFYNSPFILLDVNNRKVIVFPGGKGDAKVISIKNNTTLIEGLAMAGGIAENGKAKKIKLIRREGFVKPEVYKIDLSTIDGLQYANVVLQANDIIYVEPKTSINREIIRDLAAYLSVITSALVLYRVSQTF